MCGTDYYTYKLLGLYCYICYTVEYSKYLLYNRIMIPCPEKNVLKNENPAKNGNHEMSMVSPEMYDGNSK